MKIGLQSSELRVLKPAGGFGGFGGLSGPSLRACLLHHSHLIFGTTLSAAVFPSLISGGFCISLTGASDMKIQGDEMAFIIV